MGFRAEYWLMFCLYLTGTRYRSPNTSWTPSVRPTVWTCPGRPSGTILMASSTNASFLSHNSWPQSSVPTRKYNTPTSRPPVPVTVAVLSRLIDSECLASVFSRVNGRYYIVFIWFYRQKDDIDNCRMGYDIRSEYRCAPTNFVRRKVNLVCPEIQRVFIRSFDVPTACSCKLCYECKDVIPDPRVYINLPTGKK